MAKRAKLIFRFTIQGNGRNETLVKQPITPNADFSQSTDGNVSLNTPALLGQYTLQPGWNQLIDPAAYLLAPTTRNYMILNPSQPTGGATGQTVPPSITLAGSTLDSGVGLRPGAPMALALPPGAGLIYLYNWGSFAYSYDTWQF